MMTTEQNKASVIAKLMGFDEVLYNQQPVYIHRRILSQNYLQKSASIASLKRRSRKNQPIIKENLTLNDPSKNVSLRYTEQARHSVHGMQGVNSQNSGENGKLGNVKHAFKPSFLLDPRTTFGWEFKKQLLERSKRSKVCQEIRSSRWFCNLDETPSITDLESKQRSKLETQVVIRSNEGWKDKSITKLPIFKRVNTSSHSNTKFKNMCKGDLRLISRGRMKNVTTNFDDVEFSCGHAVIKEASEQIGCEDAAKEGCFSSSSDVSFKQDLPCEDGFKSLNCIDNFEELPKNKGEAYHPSPNSVLDPDNSSSSENGDNVSTDLNGLWMKLQILKSESEEHEMVTSSDGDATESSSLCVGQNENPIRSYGAEESREFSYLFDVLNESGFHDDNVEVSFERWHSPEPIINPLLFEKLEKKYGKLDSWSKADRQLLFDRINFRLSEILRPHVDFPFCSKPLRRKTGPTLNMDFIKDELRKSLLGQEKVNVKLSEKAVGKEVWSGLEDEMDSIVGEIEAFLFDELAKEFVAI